MKEGKYLCNECDSTIAEYREFRKPDESMNVGLANPIEQQQDTGFSDFDTPVQEETMSSEIVQEPIPTGGHLDQFLVWMFLMKVQKKLEKQNK